MNTASVDNFFELAFIFKVSSKSFKLHTWIQNSIPKFVNVAATLDNFMGRI